MMAVASPLMQSPENLMSAFSPFTDSPSSPALPRSPRYSGGFMSAEQAQQSHDSLKLPQSPVDSGPSPVSVESNQSNGTESTDIEDSPAVEVNERSLLDRPQTGQSGSLRSEISSIDTTIAVNRDRSDSDGTPQSVIHAPQGFQTFEKKEVESPKKRVSSPTGRSTPSPAQRSDFGGKNSPTISTSIQGPINDNDSPQSPPPLSTAIHPAKFSLENATPRAQTRQEAEMLQEKLRGRRSTSLEDIPEVHDNEQYVEEEYTEDEFDSPIQTFKSPVEDEIDALKTALNECWTLCNTLANLSSIHRERIFNFAKTGAGDIHEHAWKCCWRLCQKLYDSRDDNRDHHVRPTLDLCRDFCLALFEIRQRNDEVADSVLRVSFELNNHLYNTHDRNLPEAFRERTLDFYITLCHRLMKQRSGLAEETDSLLRACWSLAEMLFSLRQNKRDGKPADEELLGSAVQACWELCDLFREGWTQVRPDRGTPRPSQTTFTHQSTYPQQAPSSRTVSRLEERPEMEPETPTTIFDDAPISPDDMPAPNILVIGTDNTRQPDPRWSSANSTHSGSVRSSYTQSTASGSTATVGGTDSNLLRLKILIARAAMNYGFQRQSGQTLHTFVKSLAPTAFGSLPWQMQLLEKYRTMVLTDSAFRAPAELPSRRTTAGEVARAIGSMGSSGKHAWLKDLFRLVFGFRTEEMGERGAVPIQT